MGDTKKHLTLWAAVAALLAGVAVQPTDRREALWTAAGALLLPQQAAAQAGDDDDDDDDDGPLADGGGGDDGDDVGDDDDVMERPDLPDPPSGDEGGADDDPEPDPPPVDLPDDDPLDDAPGGDDDDGPGDDDGGDDGPGMAAPGGGGDDDDDDDDAPAGPAGGAVDDDADDDVVDDTAGAAAPGGGDDDDDDAPSGAAPAGGAGGAGGDDDDDDVDAPGGGGAAPGDGGGGTGGGDDLAGRPGVEERRDTASIDGPGGEGVRGVDTGVGSGANDGDGMDPNRNLPAGRLPAGVDLDEDGRWVRAGEVLALEAEPEDLELARSLGFVVVQQTRLASIGRSIARLRVPPGTDLRDALQTIRTADPTTAYDLNHIYFQVQTQGKPEAVKAKPATPQTAAAKPAAKASGGAIGMIDSAVAVGHPALRGAKVTQRDFAPGKGKRPNEHGTAVASLIAGVDSAAAFAGAAPRARLYAASVITEGVEGGLATAEAMVRAIDWLAQQKAPVVNISLAGPPNALLAEAVKRTQADGALLVAAVGNDGPAAPPMYPAAYQGVIGVTAVDEKGNVYRRAGRGAHVDVAAPGVSLLAADPSGAYTRVSGTSFAAPQVAAWLAQRHAKPDVSAAESVVGALASGAQDAGAAGRDPVYGLGIIAAATGGN